MFAVLRKLIMVSPSTGEGFFFPREEVPGTGRCLVTCGYRYTRVAVTGRLNTGVSLNCFVIQVIMKLSNYWDVG